MGKLLHIMYTASQQKHPQRLFVDFLGFAGLEEELEEVQIRIIRHSRAEKRQVG